MSETKLETPYPADSPQKVNGLVNSYTRGLKEDIDEQANKAVASAKIL
jgi:hypothetical protein